MSHENTPEIKGQIADSNRLPRKYKFINSFIIFILASWLFSMALFDISGYIEDHGYNYKGAEFFVMFLLLMVFYGSEHIYDRAIPKKMHNMTGKNDHNWRLAFSISLSLLFIALIYMYAIPAPSGAEEARIFKNIVAIWLISILLLNILFNSNRFQELIPAIIKKLRRSDNG